MTSTGTHWLFDWNHEKYVVFFCVQTSWYYSWVRNSRGYSVEKQWRLVKDHPARVAVVVGVGMVQGALETARNNLCSLSNRSVSLRWPCDQLSWTRCRNVKHVLHYSIGSIGVTLGLSETVQYQLHHAHVQEIKYINNSWKHRDVLVRGPSSFETTLWCFNLWTLFSRNNFQPKKVHWPEPKSILLPEHLDIFHELLMNYMYVNFSSSFRLWVMSLYGVFPQAKIQGMIRGGRACNYIKVFGLQGQLAFTTSSYACCYAGLNTRYFWVSTHGCLKHSLLFVAVWTLN